MLRSLLLALALAFSAKAMETDQFTTPKAPLYDMGPLLSQKIVEIIEADRSGKDPEQVLDEWLGHNVFASHLMTWVNHLKAPEGAGEIRFKPNLFESIYGLVFSPMPGVFLFAAPTVNSYGYYLGTDKLDHFFQQGHEYYEIVRRKRAEGASEEEAIRAAVALGMHQERNLYGTLATGVYSNGDLAANYAGMKFYLNLRESVTINGRVLPPLLVRTDEGWRLRPDAVRDRMLASYFSDHLNESLNPSHYSFSRGWIRAQVRKRSARWKKFYTDRLGLVAPAERSFAATWFGEEYGRKLDARSEISIATVSLPHQ